MKTSLLTIAIIIVMGSLFTLATSNPVYARGRYGSHHVGGYSSHGKGSHYVGGYVRHTPIRHYSPR